MDEMRRRRYEKEGQTMWMNTNGERTTEEERVSVVCVGGGEGKARTSMTNDVDRTI